MKAQMGNLAALTLLAMSGTAAAEPFTGKWRTDPGITMLTMPEETLGKGAMAMYYHGAVTLTSSKGAFAFRAECIGWQTPGEASPLAAICRLTGEAGDAAAYRLACDPPDPATKTILCWGSLRGTGGRFVGRRGAFSVVSDPKDGSAAGEGAWAD